VIHGLKTQLESCDRMSHIFYVYGNDKVKRSKIVANSIIIFYHSHSKVIIRHTPILYYFKNLMMYIFFINFSMLFFIKKIVFIIYDYAKYVGI